MQRMIYDYTKSILEKVSHAPDLFVKELKKAVKNLLPYELEHLNNWLNYYTKEKPELRKYLSAVEIKNTKPASKI